MITAYAQTKSRSYTTVTVTSDLSGTVFYLWYKDGAFVARTSSPSYTFVLETGDQARIECVDTNDGDADPILLAPEGYPARRTIYWIRSVATDVDYYLVQQKKDAGDWTTVARIPHDDSLWSYSWMSGRLDDLATYQFQIIPVDLAGNQGTALELNAEKIVRTPNAPDFDISFDADTDKVTFSEAS